MRVTISKEKKKQMNDLFQRESDIENYMAHNIAEIERLKTEAPDGSITEKSIQINEDIRYGKAVNKRLEFELASFGIAAISRRVKLPKERVKYYRSVFRKNTLGEKSGEQGLQYEKQQKILNAVQRSRERDAERA